MIKEVGGGTTALLTEPNNKVYRPFMANGF